jgi:hypothetical protein
MTGCAGTNIPNLSAGLHVCRCWRQYGKLLHRADLCWGRGRSATTVSLGEITRRSEAVCGTLGHITTGSCIAGLDLR